MSTTDAGLGGQAQEAEGATIRGKRGELLARVTFDKDKVIFREGHEGTDVFVVESGRIGVFKTVDGKPIRLAVLEKGAMFGEMAAVTGEKRTATTIALDYSVVVRIPKSVVQLKLATCDPFIRALIDILINNLSRVNERYAVKNQVVDKLLGELRASAEKAPAKSEG